MSVYLGEQGQVEIQRTSSAPAGRLASTLDPGDVDPAKSRFSFDFPASALISGDHIEIGTQDGSVLELVAGHLEPDGYWYCHVDNAGGIRLYRTFEDAVNGEASKALPLVAPSAAQAIFVRTLDETYNCVAQMRSWQITTNREAVDLTVLGNEYRDNYANGLISGQGSLSCLWEYHRLDCDKETKGTVELGHYFAQLVLRLRQGSLFKGRFYLHRSDARKDVWYEADCVVTSVGFNFAPSTVVETTVEFVTTGEVKLLVGDLPGHLLQENTFLVLAEDGAPISLEEPD